MICYRASFSIDYQSCIQEYTVYTMLLMQTSCMKPSFGRHFNNSANALSYSHSEPVCQWPEYFAHTYLWLNSKCSRLRCEIFEFVFHFTFASPSLPTCHAQVSSGLMSWAHNQSFFSVCEAVGTVDYRSDYYNGWLDETRNAR